MPRSLPIILLIAVLVRGGVLWIARGNLAADPDAYRALAKNVLHHGVLGYQDRPTAFRPPLYPLLLAPTLPAGTLGVALLHLVLGLGTVALAYRLAQLAGLARWAWLVALLTAIDPILLKQSTVVMTETLATFLATLALVALTSASLRSAASRASTRTLLPWALAGACVGLAALARPTFLLWAALVACALLCRSGSARQRLARAAAFALAVALTIAPWIVRNRVEFGRWIAGTTHGGFTLLLANNADFYDHIDQHPFQPWDATAFNQHVTPQLRRRTPAEELASNQRAYDMASDSIARAPGDFAASCLVRVASLWRPLPHRVRAVEPTFHLAARWLVGVYYAALFALCIVSLVGLPWRRSPWLWIALLLVALTATHAFYWSDPRMRSVATAGLALWAAAAFVPRGLFASSQPATNQRLRPCLTRAKPP